MNCTRGCNVLRDLPSYEASKGERIVKALRRLWEKIHCIEQVRLSENQSKSSAELDILDREDLTLNDIRYKLGMLQIQYVRSILQKKLPKSADETECRSKLEAAQTILDDKETQTGNSLIDDVFVQDVPMPDPSKYSGSEVHSIATSVKETRVNQKPNSQPHYHLKLDDVPFLLGASSTASHSIVANVQNIIAMMKTHNKALCGSKPQSVSKMTDTNKMVKKLCKELSELSVRQQQLRKKFENAEREAFCDTLSTDDNTLALGVSTLKKKTTQPKSVAPSRRVPARHKLLRSLQDFKTQLSEEDITWH